MATTAGFPSLSLNHAWAGLNCVQPCHVRSDDVAPVANVLLRCLCMASASRSDSLLTLSIILFCKARYTLASGDKVEFNTVDFVESRLLICRRYGQLSCRCVRGQSDTVNFVDFQSFNKVTKSTVLNSTLSPVCTGFKVMTFKARLTN